MPKYVLLEFDDDEAAEGAIMGWMSGGNMHPEGFDPVRVRGVYQKPTKFCDCTKTGERKPNETLVRGQKYGWYVCRVCKRPPRVMSQLLKNILEGAVPENGEGVQYSLSVHMWKAKPNKDGEIVGWTHPD